MLILLCFGGERRMTWVLVEKKNGVFFDESIHLWNEKGCRSMY